MEIHAHGPLDARPPLPPHRDRPRPRAQRRGRRERLGVDLLATQPLAGERQQHLRLGTGGDPGLVQVLALGHEQPLAVAVAPLGELSHQLELLVVLARYDVGHLVLKPKWADRFSLVRPGGFGHGVRGYVAAPSRASSANRRNVSGSRTAMSASILRFTSTPASLRPCMSSE